MAANSRRVGEGLQEICSKGHHNRSTWLEPSGAHLQVVRKDCRSSCYVLLCDDGVAAETVFPTEAFSATPFLRRVARCCVRVNAISELSLA